MNEKLAQIAKAMQSYHIEIMPLYISDEYMRLEVSGNIGLYDLHMMREYASETEQIWIITIAVGRCHISCKLHSIRVHTDIDRHRLDQLLQALTLCQEEKEIFCNLLYQLMNI